MNDSATYPNVAACLEHTLVIRAGGRRWRLPARPGGEQYDDVLDAIFAFLRGPVSCKFAHRVRVVAVDAIALLGPEMPVKLCAELSTLLHLAARVRVSVERYFTVWSASTD